MTSAANVDVIKALSSTPSFGRGPLSVRTNGAVIATITFLPYKLRGYVRRELFGALRSKGFVCPFSSNASESCPNCKDFFLKNKHILICNLDSPQLKCSVHLRSQVIHSAVFQGDFVALAML